MRKNADTCTASRPSATMGVRETTTTTKRSRVLRRNQGSEQDYKKGTYREKVEHTWDFC